jgi:exonuclease SbcC
MAARDSIAIRQPPAPAGKSLEADWLALVRWGVEQLAQVDDDLVATRQAIQERAAARADLAGAVTAACAEVGVETSLDQVRQRLATEAVETRHALAAAEDRRRRRAQLEEEVTALQQRISLHAEMGRLLSASGFERWLLQTALDDLVGRATQRLLELSSGQFSLESDDGDFWIRDHRNADELRSVRTLSGGETFLASLALALALADNIAELAVEGAPRIESMFLDEGFGTLDPDTLDIVATAMEELSASGRLIGIVTHIRELADRMPVRFEVHKDTTTARVVRVEV